METDKFNETKITIRDLNSQIFYVTLTGIIIKENSFNRLSNKETSINAKPP